LGVLWWEAVDIGKYSFIQGYEIQDKEIGSLTLNEALALNKINNGIKKPTKFIRFSWENQSAVNFEYNN